MKKRDAIHRIELLINNLKHISNSEPETESWFKNAKNEIGIIFGQQSEAYKNIIDIRFSFEYKDLSNQEQFEISVIEAERVLNDLIEIIHVYGLPDIDFGFYSKDISAKTICKILTKFSFIDWIKVIVPSIVFLVIYTYLAYIKFKHK